MYCLNIICVNSHSDYIDSLKIAEMYDRRHDHITRDIKVILEREPAYMSHFVETKYKNKRGKAYPCFLLSKEGEERLRSRYDHNIQSFRIEKAFGEWLDILFDSLHIEKQKRVGKYRVDFYLPDFSIIIEYDEKEHKYKEYLDQKREEEIIRIMQSKGVKPKIIRVQQGKEIIGIKEIILTIEEISKEPVTNYMQ
jgi:very-short-patch-repair endonuclease